MINKKREGHCQHIPSNAQIGLGTYTRMPSQSFLFKPILKFSHYYKKCVDATNIRLKVKKLLISYKLYDL